MIRRFFLTFFLVLGSWASFAQVSILHYTETTGFDHNTRVASLAMFNVWAAAHNYVVVNDDTGDEFNTLANLQQYAVVIFSNTSGAGGLTPAQRANFEAYITNGGSYMGIHAASDTYRHSTANGNNTGVWDWYAETVAGASVQESPNHTVQNHTDTLFHQTPGHPTLASLADPWIKVEEYYYWEDGYLSPAFMEVLRVGETGGNTYDAPRMMAHVRDLPGGGRAFYTALGHSVNNYTIDVDFQNFIRDALLWLLNAPGAILPAGEISAEAHGDQICWEDVGAHRATVEALDGEGRWVAVATYDAGTSCHTLSGCGTATPVRVRTMPVQRGRPRLSRVHLLSPRPQLQVGAERITQPCLVETPYRVYDLQGRTVAQGRWTEQGLPRRHLAPGLNVLRIGGHQYRIRR